MEENFIKDLIQKVAQSQDITEHSVVREGDKPTGSNYFGTLIPVTVTGARHGENVSLPMLVKTPPSNENLRVFVTLCYEREIFVYTRVLPAYEKLQENLRKKFVWAKCYYVREDVPNEVLVLQDMRADGFKHCDGMFLDLEHTLSAIETTARFHALSIVLERKDPDNFDLLRVKCFPFFALDDGGMEIFRGILKNSLIETSKSIGGTEGKILEDLSEVIFESMKASTLNSRLRVIGHTDLWKNNILFKYKDGHPWCACLIDFQTSQLSSPAADILYLIATSTDRNLRRDSFHTILRAYHKELTETLAEFTICANDVYSYEDLTKDLKEAAPASVIMSTNAFRNWCGLGHGQEEYFEGANVQPVNDKDQAKKTCLKIVRELVSDFRSFGLI